MAGRQRSATRWCAAVGPESNGLLPYQPSDHIDGRVHRDVHWLLRDPRSRERMFATPGRGTYRTVNGGANWTRLDYGIGGGYAVPIAMHPDDGATVRRCR